MDPMPGDMPADPASSYSNDKESLVSDQKPMAHGASGKTLPPGSENHFLGTDEKDLVKKAFNVLETIQTHF